jgi:hypothetical protein
MSNETSGARASEQGADLSVQPVAIQTSAHPSVATVGNPAIGTRSYFSSHYLYGAQLFTEEAGRLEASPTEPKFDARHRAFVVNAITSSCFFLEAFVNEILLDVVDRHDGHEDAYTAPLTADTKFRMRWLWEAGNIEKAKTLHKLNAILDAAEVEKLPAGRQPYQDAQLVIKLRNALVHYKVRSLSSDVPHELDADFASQRFPHNKLMAGAGHLFPDRILGHGCAEWSWQSCQAVADEFSRRLGIQPNYRRTSF